MFPAGEWNQKFQEIKLRLYDSTLQKNYVLMFCQLREERAKFRKKQKRKNLIAVKTG